MIRFINYTSIFFVFLFSLNANACTWDEPWQKEVIQQADYFVFATILDNDSNGVSASILKTFGKEELSGTIIIDSRFSHTSRSSGHGSHLHFYKGDSGYFFLKKADNGTYLIPTPTSGFVKLNADGNVYATYRHSYHQAVVPQKLFEQSYKQIWSYYKYKTYEKDSIVPFINVYIDQPRSGFAEQEINTFFKQHVALETAYLLDIPIELNRLKKFIDPDNFHSSVSALQLMGKSKSEETKLFLHAYIKEKDHPNFEKVIAIWAYAGIASKKEIRNLKRLKLSDEETGFGGNIMDPRIGTHFPSPKRAVEEVN